MLADSLSLLDAMMDSAQRDDAWRRFVERYHDTVRNWCGRRGLNDADADDLAVEIFIKLRRDLPQGKFDRQRGRFRTYLAAVVRSAVNHFFERMANRPGDRGVGGSTHLHDLQHLADPAVDELSGSLDAGLHGDIMLAFERAVARIAPENREAVERVLLHGEKAVEVARLLGKSPTSVFQLMARARTAVREEYERLLDGR